MGSMYSDVITSTSIGTSTTPTLLNNGQSYNTSNLAGCLMAVAPVYAETGAYTAGQSLDISFQTQSQSVGSIQPKNIALPPSSGGVGTSIVSMVPIVRSFNFNTRLPNSTTPIQFYGQAFVANTVAPRVGATVFFNTDQPARGTYEEYYDMSASKTSSGTAAASPPLASIVVNGGTQLTTLYGHVGPGTVTVSESYIGYITMNSGDISPIQTLKCYVQPVGVGLASTTTPLQADASYHPENITMRNTATLNATYTQEEALTAAADVYWGVGFRRQPYS